MDHQAWKSRCLECLRKWTALPHNGSAAHLAWAALLAQPVSDAATERTVQACCHLLQLGLQQATLQMKQVRAEEARKALQLST